MKENVFETLYKRLNKAQKQAVDTIEGPVMVIAGPGTGKTSILTLRIANILKKTDTAPENILALTFTESGAFSMRKKLVDIIGTAAYKVTIQTFHGFCNEIIKQYPERFPRIIGSKAIIDLDQISVLEEIIEKTKLEYLKPFGDTFFYVKPVLSEIRNLKREAVSTSLFEEHIKKQENDFKEIPEKVHVKGAHKGKMKGEYMKLLEHIEKNKELLLLYKAYEKALLEKKYYDFEDMIVEVVKVLKSDPDLLLILQEMYHYILADEHQDANNAQNAILELLSNFHENPNLFIVGDEKQAIYRFQGASLENFFYFKKMYPQALLINLEENYRSTQRILDASHSLIEKNVVPEGYKHTKLIAKSQIGKEHIEIHEFPNTDVELSFISTDIKEKIGSGTAAEEIAILYRNNYDAFAISKKLAQAGILYRIESDNDIFNNEEIRKLIIIFEVIHDLTNEEALAKLLFLDYLKIDILDVYKILKEAKENNNENKKSLFEIVFEKFPDLSLKLSSWARVSHTKPFINLFEIVIKESGFLAQTIAHEHFLERLSTLESFFEYVRVLSETQKEFFLKDFISHIESVKKYGVQAKMSPGMNKKGVRLMTAHRSKGLEFDFVYIIYAYDGHWGNKSQRSYFHIPNIGGAVFKANQDDERRLFYVALTRARKSAYITYSKKSFEGKELLPSQFLDEIDSEQSKIISHEESENTKNLFGEKIEEIATLNYIDYIQNRFLEQGLSVTALNTYIKCPWEYFFICLMRLPKVQTKHQMYGTAIHETLKTFFDKYKAQEDLSKSEFLKLFEYNLRKLSLSKDDFEQSLEKGKKSLEGYYDTYKSTWTRNLITEYGVRGVHLKASFGNVLLKGNLDKIELLNENDVNVVDYKTGKPNSKNKKNYERQIQFYKLLLDLDEKKKFNMKSGELEYIEPNDLGNYKKEKMMVVDEQVGELKKLIVEKSEEIYNLKFISSTCSDEDCEYCKLGKMIKIS